MRKLLTFALMSTLLLTGCDLINTAANFKKCQRSTIQTEKKGKTYKPKVQAAFRESLSTDLFHPMATIVTTPITYQSTNTTITTTDRKVDAYKINYHIWRTADGQENRKKLSSNDKVNNFPFILDTKDFSLQRGEYEVEAYSVDGYGKEKLMAKSEVAFQQYAPILMYHAIDVYKGQGLKGLFVDPADFEAQMQYLKDNGYTLLTFEHFDEINKVNKPILVTIDDGMKNAMNALHIFEKLQDEKFKPTATLFMIAGAIDNGTNWLSSNDLNEMVNSGIFSIQGHTMNHNDLRVITNYDEELKSSKEKIEQITGKPITTIAYPSGRFNEKVVEETKKYYQYATTTIPGQFITKGEKDELLLMHRVRISNETTLAQFAAMVN